MRLIDADAIPWDVDGVGFIPVIGKDEIDEMPEGVVRCKDCKWNTNWDGKLGCGWHGFYETGSDWFCADGERSENGKVD